MKIRKGFVSNSSSSSFVITGDKEIKFKHLCRTIEDLRNYYIKYLCGEEELEEDFKEEFEENKKAIEQGKVLLLGNMAYGSEEDFENLFDDSMNIKWRD